MRRTMPYRKASAARLERQARDPSIAPPTRRMRTCMKVADGVAPGRVAAEGAEVVAAQERGRSLTHRGDIQRTADVPGALAEQGGMGFAVLHQVAVAAAAGREPGVEVVGRQVGGDHGDVRGEDSVQRAAKLRRVGLLGRWQS